jgi:predicted nucleic acid-binding protein
MGRRAAELRARYNLSLTDAFQIAVALQSGCDAFLTNDMTLKRVSELSVVVLEEMEAEYIPRINLICAAGSEDQYTCREI